MRLCLPVTVCLITAAIAVHLAAQDRPPVRSFAHGRDPAPQRAVADDGRPSGVTRVATNQRRFTIPFSVRGGARDVVAAELHASFDRGRSWEPQGRAGIHRAAFDFTAQRDGEFWFAVQTLHRNGQVSPPRVVAPDLIVVVDTQRPTLNAQASWDAAGRVDVQWRAVDDWIAPESLVIRYRPAAGGGSPQRWSEVPLRNDASPAGLIYQDRVAFWPQTTSKELELQVEIRDRASNAATAESRVAGRRMFAQPAPADPLDPLTPSATSSATLPSPAPRSDRPSGWSATRNASTAATPSIAPQPDSQDAAPTPAASSPPPPPTAITWASQTLDRHGRPVDVHPQVADESDPAHGSEDAVAQNSPTTGAPTPGAAAAPFSIPTERSAARARPTVQSPAGTVPSRFASATSNTPSADSPLAESSPSKPPTIDPARIAQMNSLRFRLNYGLGRLDPADVREIAVWITRDGGRNWHPLEIPSSPAGPLAVEVDRSGLYGFRLVITDRSGLKSPLPAPGDSAEQWVRVDVEPPTGRIVAAPFGSGADAGKVVIQWEADDERLASAPIDLAYSHQPDGAWTPIASGLENSGRYAWEVGTPNPGSVYLHLRVRDEAGNLHTERTALPIDLGDLLPRGDILGVEPIR